MNGGSWDYFYMRVQDIAEELQELPNPLRRAFGKHLEDCAKALHDIEWVDSGDMGDGDDREAIEKALGMNTKSAEIKELKIEVKRLIEQIKKVIAPRRRKKP